MLLQNQHQNLFNSKAQLRRNRDVVFSISAVKRIVKKYNKTNCKIWSLITESDGHWVRTCEEDPCFCVSGLRDLSKAAGLMRRLVSPPCRGCSGVRSSSFSNTEEKSSLKIWKGGENQGGKMHVVIKSSERMIWEWWLILDFNSNYFYLLSF